LVPLTKSVWIDRASVRTLHARAARVKGMDLVAVAVALLAFIALYALIELVDRV
jgi:hypothetical protein